MNDSFNTEKHFTLVFLVLVSFPFVVMSPLTRSQSTVRSQAQVTLEVG